MNKNSPSENKWSLTPDQLDTRCGPDFTIGEELNVSPQWFRYNGQTLSGDTKQEIEEQQQAIKEQVKMGIIKIPKKSVPAMAPNAMGAQTQRFLNHIKKPQKNNGQTIQGNNIPRIKDSVTGKIRKIGPNERCPCGSGKKFKKCHGQ